MSKNIKKVAKDKIKNQHKPSTSKDASVNRAGGIAIDLEDNFDSITKLITMTGGSFFSEPKYYSYNTPTRGNDGKITNLKQRIEGINAGTAIFDSCSELDDTAREVISTALNVANSDNPRDLLRVAVWLRNDMNIRLTPQVLLVLASQNANTQPFVRDFASKIMVRPDEIWTCYLIHRFFFGNKTIKGCLANAMAHKMRYTDEKQLLKYNQDDCWKHLIQILPRKKNFPLDQAMADFFLNGKVSKKVTPIAYGRRELTKLTTFDSTAQKLAKETGANWEVLVSQFGPTPEVWTFLIENKLVGYMAMLRNLRNFLKADVSNDTIEFISKYLSNRQNVLKSKQLPFRFMSAYDVVDDLRELDSRKRSKILSAIEDAIELSAENIPVIDGLTVVFSDTSGSMCTPVSAKSQMSCLDAGAMLSAMIAKRGEDSYVGAFATNPNVIAVSNRDSIMTVAKKIKSANTNGCGTNAYKCIDWIMNKGIKPARVILISDMQCYGKGSSWYCDGSLADKWDAFRKSANGKDCWLHSVHINGSGDSPIFDTKQVNQTAGFSEKIIQQLLDAEVRNESPQERVQKAEKQGKVGRATPTIEQIREKYE